MSDNFHFTQRAVDWVERALGSAILTNRAERIMRFFEEAAECAQACGLTREKAMAIIDRVFGRPAGDPAQEMAGAYFTLLVLAHNRGVVLDWELMKEFRRVDTPEMIARIREKHQGKVDAGIGLPIE